MEAVARDPKDRPPGLPIVEGGLQYAGRHLIIDLWNAKGLTDEDRLRRTLQDMSVACEATLLDVKVLEIDARESLSGVAVLAESHISIHCWPDDGFVAVDIFVCGLSNPARAVPVLMRAFETTDLHVTDLKRGLNIES